MREPERSEGQWRGKTFCLLLRRSVRVKVPVALVRLATTDYGLCICALGVQIHRIGQFPVACLGAPTARVSFPGIFVKRCSSLQ